jgi:membrane-associated phospholipid phosphatase
MLRKDLLGLFKVVKSFYLFSLEWVRKNLLISLIILVLYISLFWFDPIVRDWFLKERNSFFDLVFNIGHLYGKLYLTFAFSLLLYLAGILFSHHKIRESGRCIFEAFVVSGIMVNIIKSIFGRWRPYTELGNFSFVFFTFGPNDHLSLPSGDVAVAFAFSTIVAGFVDNKVWKIFWFGLATLTALGRIYHDQHWLTDVILASCISIWVGNYINNISKHKSEFA